MDLPLRAARGFESSKLWVLQRNIYTRETYSRWSSSSLSQRFQSFSFWWHLSKAGNWQPFGFSPNVSTLQQGTLKVYLRNCFSIFWRNSTQSSPFRIHWHWQNFGLKKSMLLVTNVSQMRKRCPSYVVIPDGLGQQWNVLVSGFSRKEREEEIRGSLTCQMGLWGVGGIWLIWHLTN